MLLWSLKSSDERRCEHWRTISSSSRWISLEYRCVESSDWFSLSINLICSCLTILISVTLTLHSSISRHTDLRLCRMIGYLINGFFYGITYAYVLLSVHILHSNKYPLSKALIVIEIVIQWLLAFFIPLLIKRLDFQVKGRFGYTRGMPWMIGNMFIGLCLPMICLWVFNLITYFHLHRVRTNVNAIQQRRSSPFRQLSSRLYQRQNEKHTQLLRQTIGFFLVFAVGWGTFVVLTIVDRYQTIPDDIYLIILSFPSFSLLIITLLIKRWIEPARKSLFISNTRNSLSATTVRFSHVQ